MSQRSYRAIARGRLKVSQVLFPVSRARITPLRSTARELLFTRRGVRERRASRAPIYDDDDCRGLLHKRGRLSASGSGSIVNREYMYARSCESLTRDTTRLLGSSFAMRMFALYVSIR